jgi:hypothetical protein
LWPEWLATLLSAVLPAMLTTLAALLAALSGLLGLLAGHRLLLAALLLTTLLVTTLLVTALLGVFHFLFLLPVHRILLASYCSEITSRDPAGFLARNPAFSKNNSLSLTPLSTVLRPAAPRAPSAAPRRGP